MRFRLVIVWSALIWLSSPLLPLVRARLAGGGGFRSLISVLLVAASALAVAFAARRLRRGEHRRWRILGLALLTGALVLSAWLLAPPDPRSRLVELMHFVEFGVLGALGFGALGAERTLANRLVSTLLLVLGVGLVDETLQHLLASRFAEVRDVVLNVAAGMLGVGYAIVLEPPSRRRPFPAAREWRPTLVVGLGSVLALGLFLDRVHRAHWIRWEGVEFRSSYAERGLEEARKERARRWRDLEPRAAAWLVRPDGKFFALNDVYATEARFHVQARNEAFDRGDVRSAAFENALLERFYGPFLDAVGARRTDLPPAPAGSYRSPALPHLWPDLEATRLWGAVAMLEILLGGAILWLRKADSS